VPAPVTAALGSTHSERMTTRSILRRTLFTVALGALAAGLLAACQRREPLIDPPSPTALSTPSEPTVSESRLPPKVRAKLIELCGNCRFADSNQMWNPTDVHLGDGLPSRRLTSIKLVDDHWEIRYQRGGFTVTSYTLLLSNSENPQIMPGSTCSFAPQYECRW
jgi:hypothetical protein